MRKISIFKPCDITYPFLDKPVKYTEEFLKEIANNTSSVKIVDEHYGKSIGKMDNFTFIDGELFVDADSTQSLQKFSPSFENTTLVDEGDYYLATGGYLVEVASTVTPRLDNSNKGGSSMSENNSDNETIKILNNQVKDLNKQLAIAENKNKANEEKLKNYDELEKEVIELRKTNETNQKLIEEQKPIIEEYKQAQTAKKEELLEKASNGNSEIKAKLQDMSVDDLETIVGLQTHEQPPKGIPANQAEGLNEGDGSGEETNPNGRLSKEQADEHYKTMFGEE